MVFAFMSSITPVDIFKETPFSQSDKIYSVIKLETIDNFKKETPAIDGPIDIKYG